MSLEGVVRGLAPVNCYYNYKPEENGKCYSKDCMFNQDPDIAKEISKNGCEMYKNIVKTIGGDICFQKK
jgi:hypothetical protein